MKPFSRKPASRRHKTRADFHQPTAQEFIVRWVPLSRLSADPDAYQWRKHTSADGTVRTVEGPWHDEEQPALVVHLLVDGRCFVVDGHHRYKLAKLNGIDYVRAVVLKESDGYTQEAARVICGLLNLRNESDGGLRLLSIGAAAHHLQKSIDRDLPK